MTQIEWRSPVEPVPDDLDMALVDPVDAVDRISRDWSATGRPTAMLNELHEELDNGPIADPAGGAASLVRPIDPNLDPALGREITWQLPGDDLGRGYSIATWYPPGHQIALTGDECDEILDGYLDDCSAWPAVCEPRWLTHRVWRAAVSANAVWFHARITRLERCYVNRYDAERGTGQGLHIDWTPRVPTRRLTVIVQLSDPDEYVGGRLRLQVGTLTAPTERGTVIVFPSWIPHEAEPVTAGTRYSLTGFVRGDSNLS